MNLIAAVDKNWGIGKDNRLLVRIPEDMKYFQKLTTGKVIVVGRKTLETFPGGQPLKNRTNIVLTANPDRKVKGVVMVHSMEELLEELKKYDSQDIYIAGGESVYRQMADLCDTAYITRIDYEYLADAWFPNLEEQEAWKLTADSEEQTYFDLEYYFLKYEKKSPCQEG
ncbi:MAG: dihydrofolate reductase [Lachnospiraceae bacterium]|nr:dihydrofolate reductase [Lachnospiraceae bacterium]